MSSWNIFHVICKAHQENELHGVLNRLKPTEKQTLGTVAKLLSVIVQMSSALTINLNDNKLAGESSSARARISLYWPSFLSVFCRRTPVRQALLNKRNHHSANSVWGTWTNAMLWASDCFSWLSDIVCRCWTMRYLAVCCFAHCKYFHFLVQMCNRTKSSSTAQISK